MLFSRAPRPRAWKGPPAGTSTAVATVTVPVLVGMQEDGLLILPTHRLIGNMDGFDLQIFRNAIKEHFDIEETDLKPEQWDDVAQTDASRAPHEFALYLGATRRLYRLKLKNVDVLKRLAVKEDVLDNEKPTTAIAISNQQQLGPTDPKLRAAVANNSARLRALLLGHEKLPPLPADAVHGIAALPAAPTVKSLTADWMG